MLPVLSVRLSHKEGITTYLWGTFRVAQEVDTQEAGFIGSRPNRRSERFKDKCDIEVVLIGM